MSVKKKIGVGMLLSWMVLLCVEVQAKPTCERLTAPNLLYASQNSFERALGTQAGPLRKSEIKQGLKWADTCIDLFPDEAGCWYYRGLIKKLALEGHLQKDSKKRQEIISDLDRVIALGSGGIYRIRAIEQKQALERMVSTDGPQKNKSKH